MSASAEGIEEIKLSTAMPLTWRIGAVPAAIATAGIALDLACRLRPAELPFVAPWDFSAPEYLAAALALWFGARGRARLPQAARPGPGRSACYAAGVLLTYAVLQTHFDYLAQHMFTLTRVQHLVTHHLGPFLMVLGRPGAALREGMPAWLRRVQEAPAVRRVVAVLQQPVVAGVLFVGLIFVWLIPPVLFRVMIDARLYALMNWSMVIDGLLFWSLVLDDQPKPPARLSRGVRLLLVFAVQWPQIAGGAIIGFTERSLYPYYDLCGRLFQSVPAQTDQQIGAFLIWFGGGMMSTVTALMLLRALWAEEERQARLTIPGWAAPRNATGRSLPS